MVFFFRRVLPKTLAKPTILLFSATRTAMSSSGPNRVFQLKLDPLTGNSEWVVIDDEDAADDEHEPSPPLSSGGPDQGLLATTSYQDMLNDSRRNRAFREAIDKSLKKPCRVIDIGYFPLLDRHGLLDYAAVVLLWLTGGPYLVQGLGCCR